MDIRNGEERLTRIETVLAQVADGHFDQQIQVTGEEDAVGRLEMGINFMLMDLRAMDKSNRDKEAALLQQQDELAVRLRTIEEQNAAIRDLSTPVMEIWDDVLVLPIVGVVDTRRSLDVMNAVLERIVERQARCIIIDITGVEVVDTKTAGHLLKVSRAARLLGARCVLSGLSPAVAQTLVEIGADMTEVSTLRNLKEGLKECLSFLRKSRVSTAPGTSDV